MKIYKTFIVELLKNYLLGSAMAIIGIVIGLNMTTISLHDLIVLFGILAISIIIMFFFEYLTFHRYIQPIKAALTTENPSLPLLNIAYIQTHRIPSLSGYRILGPRFIGISIPIIVLMIVAIQQGFVTIPGIYVIFVTIGILIIVGIHAMIEFFLTSNAIQPVITELKRIAKETHQHRLSLNGKMLVSIRTKFLISTFLIGTFPLVIFALATQIQLEQITGTISKGYWNWAAISLFLSIILGTYGAWLLYSYITDPLKQLHEKLNCVMLGNYNVEAHDFYSDEFSKVIIGFNHMVRGLKQKEENNQQLIESFFITLATILDARDPYTAGHSVRVATYAVEIGKKANLTNDELSILKKSALLHDIGKIGVIDEILHKKGKLTYEEFEHIQKHPSIGEAIMLKIQPQEIITPLLAGIRSHHERMDGKGYPDNLCGDNIPINGRIIAVADAFDAMTSNRPYRLGMSALQAVEILNAEKGTQWDTQIVDLFIEWLAENNYETIAEVTLSHYKLVDVI